MIALAAYLDRRTVQSALQRLAEELAAHAGHDQGGPSARYYEHVQDTVADAVEAALRDLRVDGLAEWPHSNGVPL